MDDTAFDDALIAAAFGLAAMDGWQAVTIAAAAQAAGLPLDRARQRFPTPACVLRRFGQRADQRALSGSDNGTPREKLFDLLMRRFDALQAQREGVRAVLRHLPADPALALELGLATSLSMRWMLDAAAIPSHGLRGLLRIKGLVVVWVYALQAWERDASADLSGTMAALDRALERAERFGGWLEGGAPAPRAPAPFPDVPVPAGGDPAI